MELAIEGQTLTEEDQLFILVQAGLYLSYLWTAALVTSWTSGFSSTSSMERRGVTCGKVVQNFSKDMSCRNGRRRVNLMVHLNIWQPFKD